MIWKSHWDRRKKKALEFEMADEVFDCSSEAVVPYLVHFSKRGIVPKILRVDDYVMAMQKIPGKRLDDMLAASDERRLNELYSQLGRNVAYMNKFGVYHRDLHPGNIVVDDRRPVVIDWEDSFIDAPDDEADLIYFTGEHLDFVNRIELLDDLEKSFKVSYGAELAVPIDVTHEEIRKRALDEFGVA